MTGKQEWVRFLGTDADPEPAGDCKDYDPCMIDVLADPKDPAFRFCILCWNSETKQTGEQIRFIRCKLGYK